MNPIPILVEWAVRSSILILSGALLLRVMRVKDSSIRLAAYTVVLVGSLTIPAVMTAFPKLPLVLMPAAGLSSEAPSTTHNAVPLVDVAQRDLAVTNRFDGAGAAAMIYALVTATLLLRLCTGLLVTRRLRSTSRATGLQMEGVELRASDGVTAPVTIGITRSTIVLPVDWEEWDRAKLAAVLAHEMSHVRRRDPAVQLLSAIHRALLWHSPLSWFLHRRIVQLAEEASDDAAVAITRDRASYAEVLLEFIQRGVRRANWQGVAMARYGRPDDRIHRILDGTTLSVGVTRHSLAGIFALALPLAYITATAHPSRAAQIGNTAQARILVAQTAAAPQAPASPKAQPASGAIRRYMIFLGDTRSGSWDSRDPVDDKALRAKFGQRFAWFRQAGNEYVVTDAGVLTEIEQAMEPQNKVNRMQSDVNKRQDVVNEMQSKVNAQQNAVNALQEEVNSRQNEVNALQAVVNQRQDILNRIQASAATEDRDALIRKMEAAIRELRNASDAGGQETVNRRQTEVNAQQGRVNEEQQKVNEEQQKVNEAQNGVNAEQAKVNEQQEKVNDEQRRVSAQYSARIQEIFDSALRRGLAQRLN